MASSPFTVAIIGFGFSGLMVTTHLARSLPRGSVVYVIADDLRGLGLAYGTGHTEHLLNVPAGRMGAFAEDVGGFYQWLHSAQGVLAKQQLKLTASYTETDFVPRALYGAYLQDVWRSTQEIAAQHGCNIKLVETRATRIRRDEGLTVLTARGDAIAVDTIVLAVGNETKPIALPVKSEQVIQNPWTQDVFSDAAQWASPVMLMGAGLTAVDTVLSLRKAGYKGEIVVFSRQGKWPEAHAPATRDFQFDKAELFAQQTLQQLLRYLRRKIEEVGEWRVVIDALRPHTQALWQKLTARDQQRFIARLLPRWNVHRHRMAPEIAATLAKDKALMLQRMRTMEARQVDAKLEITLHDGAMERSYHPSKLINCTGSELKITKSRNPLLVQALADGVLDPHANGLGVSVDPNFRAWGAAHPHLYVIGTWMTGQFLESTAVPELRQQAASIAAHLVKLSGG